MVDLGDREGAWRVESGRLTWPDPVKGYAGSGWAGRLEGLVGCGQAGKALVEA